MAQRDPLPERTRVAGEVEFRREALPPLPALAREWRMLETVAAPSFFTSWWWIGTLLATVPVTHRPSLLRGVTRGETVALALLGSGFTGRRHGLVRSRSFHLNEIGDARFDALAIEHNGILAAAAREPAVYDAALAWFAGLSEEADELYLSGSLLRLPENTVEGRGLGRSEISLPLLGRPCSVVAGRRRALPSAQHQCAPAASPGVSQVRALRRCG